jgi:PAS domain-containing protein
MPEEVRRLLQSHKFLELALADHGARLSPRDAENLRSERDRMFLKLVIHKSDNPRVTLAQLNFLQSALAEQPADRTQAALLRQACADVSARLAAQAEAEKKRSAALLKSAQIVDPAFREPTAIGPAQFAVLDCMVDRAAILDRDYRYVFTNAANADFYGVPQQDFVSRPIATVIGTPCFEALAKPHYDTSFAGKSHSIIVAHDSRRGFIHYSISYDPIRDRSGAVTSALVVARDVTSLGIETPLVWPRATA